MKSGFVTFWLFPALLAAQNVITGAGYSAPAPLSLAPGQIITLFVDGVGKSVMQPVRAPDGSSATLAGISVTLRQSNTDLGVPILEIRPVSTCPAGSPPNSKLACTTLAAITVQVPYELIPLCPLCLRPVTFPPPWLYVTEAGQSGAAFEVTPLADQIHVLTSCDTFLSRFGIQLPQNLTGLRCPPVVTHPDGTVVSADNPAQNHERLTAWVVGLGYTDPAAVTGQVVPQARAVTSELQIDFNFRVNALPVKPQILIHPAVLLDSFSVYAALSAGFVGLYQIDFTMPVIPQGTLPCVSARNIAPGASAVQSNLTVSFGAGFSFDGAGICAAAPLS